MSIEQLWITTEGKLRNYLLSKLTDHSQVDDLLQNVFLKVRANIHQLKKVEKADAWVFQLTRNSLMDHFRKEKKRQQQVSDFNWPTSEQITDDKTQNLALWIPEAIQLLPEKYREAIYLTEIKGMSQKELAEHLNISYSGAKSRVQRGRLLLKEIILACCDVAADKYGNIIEYKSRACEEC